MDTRIFSAFPLILFAAVSFGCRSTIPVPPEVRATPGQKLGVLESHDPRFFAIIPPTAVIEKLAEGFDWSEGPVWIRKGGYLLFSDVPSNTVYKWKEGSGVSVFLKPSGYTGSIPRAGEPGSNGLTVDSQGRLVLCEHGDRRVARLEAGRKTTLAGGYLGKRLNSPNDLVFKSNGDLYFTDPPYGLVGNVTDPAKELPFQGVYRVTPSGAITLLTDQLTRPNGLAFSPDEKKMYVSVSDPAHAVWMQYDVKADGMLENGRVFFDVTSLVGPAHKGLPDGMKVDAKGNLFATGPGGVFVFAPDGTHLGTINTGEATGNVAWGEDGSTLFITADMYICRIKTLTKGAGF